MRPGGSAQLQLSCRHDRRAGLLVLSWKGAAACRRRISRRLPGRGMRPCSEAVGLDLSYHGRTEGCAAARGLRAGRQLSRNKLTQGLDAKACVRLAALTCALRRNRLRRRAGSSRGCLAWPATRPAGAVPGSSKNHQHQHLHFSAGR